MSFKFKEGDKVVVVRRDYDHWCQLGDVHTITTPLVEDGENVYVVDFDHHSVWIKESSLELVGYVPVATCDPIKMRDTIIELEAYEEHFRRQRDELTDALLVEGFTLVQMLNGNLDKVDQLLYSNPERWEVDDLVECVKSAGSLYGAGNLYRIYSVTENSVSIRDDDDSLEYPSFCTYALDAVTIGSATTSSFKFYKKG